MLLVSPSFGGSRECSTPAKATRPSEARDLDKFGETQEETLLTTTTNQRLRMGIFSFLRSSAQPTPDLFEKELVELELKIQKHQDRLKAIDQRQRSTTSTITIYSSLFWAIYSSLWYLGWTPIRWTNLNNKLLSRDSKTLLLLSTNPKFNQALQVLPIILIPIGSVLYHICTTNKQLK
jgi:hypothetical protein